MTRVDGLLFDKDGTLFDFRATWDVWAVALIGELSAGDPACAARLAQEMRFDLALGRFEPESAIIAGTNRDAAEAVARALPARDVDELELLLTVRAAEAPLAPAVPLAAFVARLKIAGFSLGVATNDAEEVARAHLAVSGVGEAFDFVAGFDSGFGAKPAPGMLLAFADTLGLKPERCVMVGDSAHDLVAGARAGFVPVGVLTGVAGREELAPLAEVVLPDIGHLPGWLGL